jgi:hypothetical protein
MDGKAFFKNVRNRLEPKEFHDFLLNIKDYNNKTQSKAETLRKVSGILGDGNRDLYKSFEEILSPN